MRAFSNFSFVVLAFVLAACSTPPRVAQNKSVQVQGKKLEFGGSFDADNNRLRITINGEPRLQGDFSRFSPTLNLSTPFDDLVVSAECYFGSILNKGPGGGLSRRIVARSVQGGLGKSDDICDLLVGGKKIETLLFSLPS
ncbi:MAG TPA: hypothetical protein VFR90_04010 [Methylibium sp.]|uniref:hypothetical protein n=1 Tax=Methylibium sp. TaxID=2067992 RepID=UPI002DBE7AC2|nr:hypothetical protein [Methylibium sp.]HEU4458264.1 hypothetical protein [Methylibium sp.]